MKDCRPFQHLVEDFLADQLDQEQQIALQRHLDSCPDCRQITELHRELATAGPEMAQAARQELDAMRRSVLLETASRRPNPTPGARRSFRSGWQLRPVFALAASLVLLLAGAGLGRLWPQPAQPELEKQDIIREISDMAAAHRRLADVENSEFIYSNVSFRKLDEERVALNFDVTTHVDMVEPVSSPLVQEVLVQSLLHPDPANLGNRLEAISYAEKVMDAKVRDALILAMHQDESLAVRLKALSLLASQAPAEVIEAAFLHTLSQDEAVQMRLLALDYLANQGVSPDLIRRTIEEAGKESNPAVLLQAASYEK